MTGSEINRRILIIHAHPSIHSDFRKILAVKPKDHDRPPGNETASAQNVPLETLPTFEVESTEQGQLGRDMVKSALQAGRPYSVAFVDMGLSSGWNGMQTLEELWKIDQDLQCVLCTASSNQSLDLIVQRAGHCDKLLVLRKPFDVIEVRQLAISLTHKWHLAKQATRSITGLSALAAERTQHLREANARLINDNERRREAEERYVKAVQDLERKNTELAVAHDELAASKSYVDNLLHSMADTLVVIDARMVIGSVNRALLILLGYQEDELVGQRPGKIFGQELAHGSIIETLLRDGSISNVETAYFAKDGRIIPTSCSGSLMQDEHGQFQGMVCVAQDITHRRRMEEEKRQLNERLVETSRRLGMAEVASSVLHNVGNILNSINVSVGLMTRTLKQSLVGDVGRISKMLQEHSLGLGPYLSLDPKGKQIPNYLAQLGDHLAEESRITLKEVESLNEKLEHVKHCVAMQQGMAKAGGLHEMVALGNLMEQALTINSAALERHCIDVIRDYADIPAVVVDKHQVVQILVNLIRNAMQAMQSKEQRLLTLRIGYAEGQDQMVRLQVADTGTGVHRDNLTRIFAQGFTTKTDGHGFGLHSGALMAKNMGGALSVQSDGEGCGATFTLDLPSNVRLFTPETA